MAIGALLLPPREFPEPWDAEGALQGDSVGRRRLLAVDSDSLVLILHIDLHLAQCFDQLFEAISPKFVKVNVQAISLQRLVDSLSCLCRHKSMQLYSGLDQRQRHSDVDVLVVRIDRDP